MGRVGKQFSVISYQMSVVGYQLSENSEVSENSEWPPGKRGRVNLLGNVGNVKLLGKGGICRQS